MTELKQYLQNRVEVLEHHKALLISALLELHGELFSGLSKIIGNKQANENKAIVKARETLAKLEE